MVKPKIIVLNQCTVSPSFEHVQNACLDTWVKDNDNEDIKVINYFGGYNNDKTKIDRFKCVPNWGDVCEYEEDDINYMIVGCYDLTNHDEDVDHRGFRLIHAFEYLLKNYEFDYIYRTGCTSYVILDRVYNVIRNLPSTRVYTGTVFKYWVDPETKHFPFYFVLGADAFISRDMVELAVRNKSMYIELSTQGVHFNSFEDAVLGRILTAQVGELHMEHQFNLVKETAMFCKDVECNLDDPNAHNFRFRWDGSEQMRDAHRIHSNNIERPISINYIMCLYLDPERVFNSDDMYYHLKKHLEAIRDLDFGDIHRVTIMVNDSEHYDHEQLHYIVNSYNLKIPVDIKHRPNRGRSYAAWEQQIRESLGSYDYYFLIEDDYYPVADRFYEPFLIKFNKKIGYVCMQYKYEHPSHSIGLISAKVCRDLLQKRGEIFANYKNVVSGEREYIDGCYQIEKTDYGFGNLWQLCFHKWIEAEGYEIVDMREYPTYYRDVYHRVYQLYPDYTETEKSLILPTENELDSN